MENPTGILFTGGSGLLGSEFRKLVPRALYPSSSEFNVTDIAQMERYIADKPVHTVIHAAAFISAPKIDKDPLKALDVNIVGTANVTRLCMQRGIKLVYISTDYVFDGQKGRYKETDPVLPVNKYAWSKLGGECAVSMHDRHLIIRTSFGPNVFPYEMAPTDQWTSRESVSVIAGMIHDAVKADLAGLWHVGGGRKTVYSYARRLGAKGVKKTSIKNFNFKAPSDTSLDVGRFKKIIRKNEKNK